ncbi:MAG: ABC transporter ATP-binding protein [Gammaproteobacteria bacterium]|nr:MAG: ABC transporter ATP-binding protein [Gammaproteobacteria bacterium]
MFNYYLRLAWKSLWATPVVTLLMLIAIALGIGSAMGTLTIYHLMSADPIPEKSAQLFAVQLKSYDNKQSSWGMNDGYPLQITHQDAVNLSHSSVAVKQTPMVRTGFAVQTDNPDIAPILKSVRAANSDFFAMFNAPFAYGSAWDKNSDQQALEVTVIGAKLNQQLFGGGNNVGKILYFDQKAFRIVGILQAWQPTPQYYDVNNGAFRTGEQIFIPFALIASNKYRSWGNNNSYKNEEVNTFDEKLVSESHWIQYWVELKNPQQKNAYQAYLKNYISQQKQLGRFERDDASADLKNVTTWLTYNEVVSEDNNVLVGLSFLLLVVCLVNTVGLLLAKFLRRAPEVGVRRALGASQTQVFLQHLVEVSLLGLTGGLLGILLAQLGLWLLKNNYEQYQLLTDMDITMLLTAPVLAIGSSIIAGLYPAWKICRTQPAVYLKSQ